MGVAFFIIYRFILLDFKFYRVADCCTADMQVHSHFKIYIFFEIKAIVVWSNFHFISFIEGIQSSVFHSWRKFTFSEKICDYYFSLESLSNLSLNFGNIVVIWKFLYLSIQFHLIPVSKDRSSRSLLVKSLMVEISLSLSIIEVLKSQSDFIISIFKCWKVCCSKMVSFGLRHCAYSSLYSSSIIAALHLAFLRY